MIRVGKHINNIILNPLEYLLDDNNEIKYFDSYTECEQFLLDNGYTEDDLDIFTYENVQLNNGKEELI